VSPGNYVYRVKVFNGDGTKGEKVIAIRIYPPWWSTWLFRISAIIFSSVIFYGLIRWRLKQKFSLQLERSEKDRQMAELKQKGTELEMQALRAQMNPHFIFNSLNSINWFIQENNKAKASEYLTKFSKLVRLILQNSKASLIPLESELESLALYLDLEGMRFDYQFSYKISVSPDVDISMLKVPPLIIQPYVENAIWHGLLHKDEEGQLDIEVTEEEDQLCFKITDNGIGRNQAAVLGSKSATKHKSMGTQITGERIAKLQLLGAKESFVKIYDLLLMDGSSGGTEVVIKIPVMYD
jgi:sensor histidine kinase YesM